jgi:hypothetical protein
MSTGLSIAGVEGTGPVYRPLGNVVPAKAVVGVEGGVEVDLDLGVEALLVHAASVNSATSKTMVLMIGGSLPCWSSSSSRWSSMAAQLR